VHCYSLVHDDLPAMDNDALRRGQPTVHKAFDEATAILAGDGLLTFAFDILARPETHPSAAVRVELVLRARARGRARRAWRAARCSISRPKDASTADRCSGSVKPRFMTLQAMKTGALLSFGCRSGGILGEAPAEKRAALERYGSAVGRAFQIADDLARCGGRSGAGRQQTGKDAGAGKATIVGILGTEGAKARLRTLVAEAASALAPFGSARLF